MTSTPTLDLATAERQASDATAAAEDVRARVAAGDSDVTATQLADVEAAERFARQRLDAARERDRVDRERRAAEELEAARAAMQQEYTAAAREPDSLSDLRAAAVDACVDYLTAAGHHESYLRDLHERAVGLGFRVPDRPDFSKSPLPDLAKRIVSAARAGAVPQHWTVPAADSRYGSLWSE